MPLYEYYCKRCDTPFERLRPSSEHGEPARCASGHVSPRQVVSMFATLRSTSNAAMESIEPRAGGCACGGGGCGCGH